LSESHYKRKFAERVNKSSNSCYNNKLHASHFACPVEEVVLIPDLCSFLGIEMQEDGVDDVDVRLVFIGDHLMTYIVEVRWLR